MAWYTILFITTLCLFVIKLIMSLVGGDIDMDVDMDGVDDFDASSAFSFKGLIHFLLGFSSYLFLRANSDAVMKVNGIANFSFIDYIIAVIFGIAIVLILIFIYKLVLRANNETKNPQDLIDNCKGIVYINLGNGQYSVQAHTLAGTTNVTAFYSGDELNVGTEVTLIKEGNKILIDSIIEGNNLI